MLRSLRQSSFFILPVLLLALGGCSVFGVATKGELEAAIDREAELRAATEVQLEQLTAQLADAREDMAALEQRLAPRLADLDSSMVRTEREVARTTQQWREVQALVVSDLDSVRARLADMSGDVAAMNRGMTVVRATASSAEQQSREAMRRQYETLQQERDHLLGRLRDLEARLATWPAQADSLADGLAASPRRGAGEDGTVIIRPASASEQPEPVPPRR
jgi:chromosome segregation ATPase